MRPAANARTDPKVYVDCHGDYRISAIIYTNRQPTSRDFHFQFIESLVMVCGIVDNAIRLIDKAFRTTIFRRVIDIRFVITSAWQLAVVIFINIAANHHADCCPRIEIPFFESVPCFRFVQGLNSIFRKCSLF